MKVLVVLCLLAAPARADVELWTELGVKRAATERLDLTLDTQLRFDENLSRVRAVMPELGVRVQIRKWLRAGASYRYEYERDGDEMLVSRHRFEVFGRLRTDLGRLRVELDTRLQEQLRPGARDDQRHVLRERVRLAWRGTRPWIPSASVTVFESIDELVLDKLWLTAGTAYERRRREIELFYRFERPLHDPRDPAIHIVGATFHQEL